MVIEIIDVTKKILKAFSKMCNKFLILFNRLTAKLLKLETYLPIFPYYIFNL